MRLIKGDCRDAMLSLALDGETFDSVVTDPPYHLTSTVERFGKAGSAPAKSDGATGVYARASRGFMGKEWDGGDVAFQADTWRACWDLLKPGAHLVAFGGSRTYHRIACAIEDAGFEIRDSLMWLYGTGFPKSHDVAKGIDKQLGVTGTVTPNGSPVARMIPGNDQNESGSWIKDSGRTYQPGEYEPGSAEAAAWQGWGTALKPAFEPIILARKPLAGTVAANVLQHGTGALNIDACRIELAPDDKLQDGITGRNGRGMDESGAWGFKAVDRAAGLGRWPANVLHDGSPEVLEAFAAYGERPGQQGRARTDGSPKNRNVYGSMSYGTQNPEPRGDTGSAARFFYSAKASAADRAGSKHPTVKPLALMRWLCRLVTPPGGHILDPFGGSGSTLQAAHECGFSATTIELDPEYQADIERRILSAMLGE